MADKVVQRLATPDISKKTEPIVQAKTISNFTHISTNHSHNLVQNKCAECEKEEKLQKKENTEIQPELQLKPIFESGSSDDDSPVQRKCATCGHEEEKKVQKKTENSTAETASPSIESNLSASKGGGSPLPENTRNAMESSFGSDFSGVRIHTGSNAVQMSQDLNAQAFTHENDIYFNAGKYDTNSQSGQHLLAHELTHTVQQGGVRRKMIQKVPQDDHVSQARQPQNNNYPTIGPTPLASSYDYVFKIINEKEILKGYENKKNWEFLNKEVTLFKFPTELGVMLDLNGFVKLGADFGVKIGPLLLRNVKVGLSKSQVAELAGVGAAFGLIPLPLIGEFLTWEYIKRGHYWGEATLDFSAIIEGGFSFSAGLNADAKFLNIFKIAGLSAGFEAAARAKVQALANASMQIEFKNGEMIYEKSLFFESDFLLQLILKAFLKAQILGWTFDLANISFEKDFSKQLFALTLGTPFKINSSNPNTPEFDVEKTIEKIKEFIDIFKEATSTQLHGERAVGDQMSMGKILPPKSIIPAQHNLLPLDNALSVYLANERAATGADKFDDFVGSNVAVFKYSILEPQTNKEIDNKYESAPNTRGELHSEALILGKLQKLQKKYKKGLHTFKVTHVLSERQPCSSCQSYLNQPNQLIQTKNTNVFWLVPYLSGKSDAYLENIRTLIMKYGLTPPTLEQIKEAKKKKKDASK